MKIRMKRFLSLVMCGIMILSLSACGSSEKSNSETNAAVQSPEENSNTVTAGSSEEEPSAVTSNKWGELEEGLVIELIGEFDPQVSGQQIIADHMEYFAEEGINCHLNLTTDPSISTALQASGDAPIYSTSNYGLVNNTDKGIDFKVVSMLTDAGNTQVVVGREDLNLTSAKDLEGLKMGYTEGAGVIVAVRKMCEDLGVDFDSFEFVNLQASEMLSSLERKDIDFFAAWEPWGLKAQEFGGKLLFTGLESYLPDNEGPVEYLHFTLNTAVDSKFYESHPAEVYAYLSAMQKATDYINNNKEEAAQIIADAINIDYDMCYAIMDRNLYTIQFPENFKDQTMELSNYMQQSGMTSTEFDYDNIIDTTILDSLE